MKKGKVAKMAMSLAFTGALMATPAMGQSIGDGGYTLKACTPDGMTATVKVQVGNSHTTRAAVEDVLNAKFTKAARSFRGDTGLDEKFEGRFGKAPVPAERTGDFREEIKRDMSPEAFDELAARGKTTLNVFREADRELSAITFGARLFPLTPGCTPK